MRAGSFSSLLSCVSAKQLLVGRCFCPFLPPPGLTPLPGSHPIFKYVPLNVRGTFWVALGTLLVVGASLYTMGYAERSWVNVAKSKFPWAGKSLQIEMALY